jgi:hypothetical protein
VTREADAPRTETGKRLSERLLNHSLDFDRSIAAIEAEAAKPSARDFVRWFLSKPLTVRDAWARENGYVRAEATPADSLDALRAAETVMAQHDANAARGKCDDVLPAYRAALRTSQRSPRNDDGLDDVFRERDAAARDAARDRARSPRNDEPEPTGGSDDA